MTYITLSNHHQDITTFFYTNAMHSLKSANKVTILLSSETKDLVLPSSKQTNTNNVPLQNI